MVDINLVDAMLVVVYAADAVDVVAENGERARAAKVLTLIHEWSCMIPTTVLLLNME